MHLYKNDNYFSSKHILYINVKMHFLLLINIHKTQIHSVLGAEQGRF